MSSSTDEPSMGTTSTKLMNPLKMMQEMGTHVAGIMCSENMVYRKNASSSLSKAVNDIIEKGRTTRAVINLYFGGDASVLWHDAIRTAYDKGVITVVAAGNLIVNASSQGPGYMPQCITVGATDAHDRRVGGSDFGEAIDVFAPGHLVRSPFWRGNNGFNTRVEILSGTSTNAAFVSRLALYLQALESLKTPKAVADRIIELPTNDMDYLGCGAWEPEQVVI
ncbi:subtilisin-like protein [Pseudovirgaria hyperparasitica]|uniref:Subtilisin-like protein n=1 Tax=Pseudovirgaria hyperparasitica TaxID=470096 RepID=A0A6A6WLG0_9PEZI|nr:subtilisin-like protein [Pseudovirgaria hyperparasitica]KAF2762988.1 subtilisin-like protein [Pseudovirgaria hyperparasitica]